MIQYVCGFLMSESGHVLLLKKLHGPPHLIGQWNGVGGKVEDGETSEAAMTREFVEETNWDGPIAWRVFCSLLCSRPHDEKVQIDFYFALVSMQVLETIDADENETVEPLGLFRENLLPLNIVPNMRWLVPMARSFVKGETAESFIVYEQRETIGSAAAV